MSLPSSHALNDPVTGVMDAKDACKVVEEVIHDFTHPAPGSSSAVVYVSGSTTGIWFGGDVWGYIALLFSLSTNIVATTLIAYRAWCAPQFFDLDGP